MKSFKLFLFVAAVYFFSWLLVYSLGINETLIQSEDALPAFFLPAALVENGNFYLDDYYELLISRYPQPDDPQLTPFYLRKVAGHYVSAFPVVASILAVPVYFLPLKLGLPVTFETVGFLGHIGAALTVAGSVVVMHLIFRRFLSERLSAGLSLVYAFSTCSFALSSQSMWQHGASQLMLSFALYFLVRGFTDGRMAPWAGLFLSLATLSRHTNAISVILLSLYYLRRFGFKSFLKFTGLGFVPLGLFLTYTHIYFGSLANQGYATQIFTNWTGPFPGGFLGEWFSPSKGLLVYSPVFIFSLLGVWLLVRRRSEIRENLFGWIFAIVISHSLVLGKWIHWYGGYAFGYRMIVDMTPYLAFLWIPLVESAWWEKVRNWFGVAAIYSLGVQLMGVVFYNGVWHGLYDNGPRNQGWLWSIRDAELVYYLRRVIEKLVL